MFFTCDDWVKMKLFFRAFLHLLSSAILENSKIFPINLLLFLGDLFFGLFTKYCETFVFWVIFTFFFSPFCFLFPFPSLRFWLFSLDAFFDSSSLFWQEFRLVILVLLPIWCFGECFVVLGFFLIFYCEILRRDPSWYLIDLSKLEEQGLGLRGSWRIFFFFFMPVIHFI